MQEVFEKIKERLEAERKLAEEATEQYIKSNLNHFKYAHTRGRARGFDESVEIVNQVAEEYNQSLTNDGWIPVTKELPKFDETVQITYISCIDRETPFCDGFAFYEEDEWRNVWRWSFDSSPVNVEVVAWRRNCKPYRPKGE